MVYYSEVGEIIKRNDEWFWIFHSDYLYHNNYSICSPWFLHMGRQWRLIKDPFFEDMRKNIPVSNLIFRLWPKFIHEPKRFTTEMSLKTSDDQLHKRTGVVDSDYGCEFHFYFPINPRLKFSKNKRVKLVFNIERKENDDNTAIITEEKTIIGDEKNNEDEKTKEEENSCEYEGYKDKISDEDGETSKKNTDVAEAKGVDKLVKDLKSLLENGQNSDVTLKIQDHQFKVHKNIMIVRSPVFETMLQQATDVVDIPNCTAEAFEIFLTYVYTGKLDSITSDSVFDLYYAASKYQINDLKSECVEFMKNNVTIETFFAVMTLSLENNELCLQEKATEFFSDNLKTIIKTVHWQEYLKKNPIQANELYIKAVNA